MSFDGSLRDEFATTIDTNSGNDLYFTGQSKTISIPDASGTIISTGNLKYIDGQNATALKMLGTLKSLRHAEFGISGEKTTILGTSIFDGGVSFGHSNFNNNIINLKGTLIASTLIFGKANNSGSYHQSLDMTKAMDFNRQFVLPSSCSSFSKNITSNCSVSSFGPEIIISTGNLYDLSLKTTDTNVVNGTTRFLGGIYGQNGTNIRVMGTISIPPNKYDSMQDVLLPFLSATKNGTLFHRGIVLEKSPNISDTKMFFPDRGGTIVVSSRSSLSDISSVGVLQNLKVNSTLFCIPETAIKRYGDTAENLSTWKNALKGST